MVSRALSLATVTLLIGCLAAGQAHAQATNLEAGKSPSQIFAGTCNACHKSPRGLLKTVSPSSLPGFLRQHYTTSSDMASVLSSYLTSNGATDTRYQGKPQEPAKPGRDGKPEARPDARQEAARPPEQLDRWGRRQRTAPAEPTPSVEQSARPDADGLTPQTDGGRAGRNAKRPPRPEESPEAATEAKPGSRERLSKRGKGGEESAKPDAAKPAAAREEPARSEPSKEDLPKAEAAKGEAVKPDAPKETGGQPTAMRPDPVPPVTPAASTPPVAATPSPAEPAASPAAAAPAAPAAPSPAPAPAPAVTADVPPPPAAPAGPPEPPISR